MQSWPPKDPHEILDYQMDWSDRLVSAETILTSSFTIASGDVVKDSQGFSGAITTVWLSGGTEGAACTITNRVTTSGGRTYDESAKLRIRSK